MSVMQFSPVTIWERFSFKTVPLLFMFTYSTLEPLFPTIIATNSSCNKEGELSEVSARIKGKWEDLQLYSLQQLIKGISDAFQRRYQVYSYELQLLSQCVQIMQIILEKNFKKRSSRFLFSISRLVPQIAFRICLHIDLDGFSHCLFLVSLWLQLRISSPS